MFRPDILTRPYRTMEFVDAAWFGVFSRRLADFALPVVLYYLVFLAVEWGVLVPTMGWPPTWLDAVVGRGADIDFMGRQGLALFVLLPILGLLAACAGAVLLLYVLRRMESDVLGRDERPAESLRHALEPLRFLSLLLNGLLGWIMLAAATMLFVLPAVPMTMLLFLVPAAVALSPQRFDFHLGEAIRLQKGNFGRTAGVVLILLVLPLGAVMIASLVGMLTLGLFTGPAGGPAPLQLATLWTNPLLLGASLLTGAVELVISLLCGYAMVLMYLNYRHAPAAGQVAAPEESPAPPAP